jgi:hypothetical protein
MQSLMRVPRQCLRGGGYVALEDNYTTAGQKAALSQTFCFRVSATAPWVQGRRVACLRAGILIDP